ncbi:MAG: hypothetical protein FJX76_26585 [Armatimonadetes bacterium]|nr:hypothetical protein [Armatimonadota bacterium]
MKLSTKPARRWLAAILITLAAISPSMAYEDLKFNYSVASPQDWLVVKLVPQVPGIYRFGWMSPSSLKDRSGANVLNFVQLLDNTVPVPELLSKNAAAARKAGLKVVKEQVVSQGGVQGFVMETSGMGNGYTLQWKNALGEPRQNVKTDNIPTRQRFFALVKGKQIVALMSTCSETTYNTYAPVFNKIEKTLVLK